MPPSVHCPRAPWLALLLSLAVVGRAQAPPLNAGAAGTAPLSGPEIIQLLDQTIDWYRTLGIEQQASNQPSDLFVLNDNRQTAGRVIGLAFDIARADTELLAKGPAGPASVTRNGVTQPILEWQGRFAKQLTDTQAKLDQAQRALAQAGGMQTSDAQAKVSELQGEMALFTARQSVVGTLLSIVEDSDVNGFSPEALRAQIDAMAVAVGSNTQPTPPLSSGTVPSAAVGAAAVPLAAATSSVGARHGIWDLAGDVFKLSEKLSTIDALDQHTAQLTAFCARLREPLTTRLKNLSAQGDLLSSAAEHADAAGLRQTRQALDALGDQFKTVSGLLIPLGKIGVLLTQYRHNLHNWHGLVSREYGDALKTLGVRLLGLVLALAAVFIAAALWRRAVQRYIQEARRRTQLLLVERIVIGALVALIVGFAVISELTALFTFAGLITAGLAVAMQSILVSFIGYFLLIGKYGLRLGDRVQVGEVVGEVIELGLVRLHLMELGAKGLAGPTGRTVAFPNSVVFQVTTGLFKQITGVNLAWHELTLNLPAGVDYNGAKQRLLATVHGVLKDSHAEVLRQAEEIQRTTASNSGADAEPRVQLAFSAAGVEAKVRYPVQVSDAADLDERVSRELLATLKALNPVPAP